MPVDRTIAEDIGINLIQLYADAEARITAEMARRLAEGLDQPDWAEQRLAALGDMRRWTQRLLNGLSRRTQAEAAAAVLHAAVRGHDAAMDELERRRETNGRLWRILRAGHDAEDAARTLSGSGTVARIAGALSDRLTNAHTPVLRWVDDAYREVIARTAVPGVALGIDTREQAAERAWRELLDRGITGFVDRAGRRWNLASYVEMATRTSLAQAAIESHLDQLRDNGVDLIVVSDAPQECHLCRPWEGRILSISGPFGARTVQAEHGIRDDEMVDVDIAGSFDEAIAAGLMHPNCRHTIGAYLPGVTRIPTNTADPEGDAARRRLRELERRVRRAKLQAEAALTPAGKAAARARVRALQGQIRDHVAANQHLGIFRQPNREQIDLGNRPGPAPTHVRPPRRPRPPSPRTQAAQPPPAPGQAPPLPRRGRATPPPPPDDTDPPPPPWEAEGRPPRIGELIPHTSDEAFERRDEIREALTEMINGEYGDFIVDIDPTDIDIGENRLGFRAMIRHQDGDIAGQVVRNFYRGSHVVNDPDALWAEHEYLALSAARQGQGFAEEWNGRLERWYRRSGLQYIAIHANIDVGGYAWARQGYDFEDESEADRCLDRLRDLQTEARDRAEDIRNFLNGDADDDVDVENLSDEDLADLASDLADEPEYAPGGDLSDENREALFAELDELERDIEAAEDILERASWGAFGGDDYPTAWEISDCGRRPGQGGRDDLWIGKRAMLGSSWRGIKWLL